MPAEPSRCRAVSPERTVSPAACAATSPVSVAATAVTPDSGARTRPGAPTEPSRSSPAPVTTANREVVGDPNRTTSRTTSCTSIRECSSEVAEFQVRSGWWSPADIRYRPFAATLVTGAACPDSEPSSAPVSASRSSTRPFPHAAAITVVPAGPV